MSVNNREEEPAFEQGRVLFARHWAFLKSVNHINGLPDFQGVEIAFAGRSNVGKSSLINALTATKSLARTSNTPGRTQYLNYFLPAPPDERKFALVDMPGYGFANAPKTLIDQWTALIMRYLRERRNLRRVYVLIDSRRDGLKENDCELLDLLDKCAVSYQVVLTKTDKVRQSGFFNVKKAVKGALKKRPAAHPEIIATSSEKGFGLVELRAEIAQLVER